MNFFKKQKKIYIPDVNSYIGGPKTFLTNLKDFLKDKPITTTDNLDKASAILFPVAYDKQKLINFKQKGGKIIQRLDGIYYPSKHNEKEMEFNKEIQDIYLNYADYVVFQSKYSKRQCFEILGEKPESQFSLIINGVNKQIFFPNKDLKKDETTNFITTGSFRNIDMIEPVVLALDKLKDKYKFRLNIVGKIINDDLKQYFERDYINLVGDLSLEEVAEQLRQNHIFIYSHLNPPCPNSVIEAISTGLPVVGFDSGAMSELLPFSTELLANVSDDLFQKYEDFDFNKLAEKIAYSIDNYNQLSQKALENSHLYDFNDCGAKYIDIFKKVLNE